ncbi:hypothetical protein THIOKS11090004 [Thiocapsa sp. KS1]|nr:hypothetical protein THIOKS11090004 [Thiocapsa sp. KS1]
MTSILTHRAPEGPLTVTVEWFVRVDTVNKRG